MVVELMSENIELLERWSSILKDYETKCIEKIVQDGSEKVVLADLATNAKDIANHLKSSPQSEIAIIALEGVPSTERGKTLLINGVKGYGNAYMQPIHLKSCVESVAGGFVWVYPELVREMVSYFDPGAQEVDNGALPDIFTEREKQIVSLLLEGKSNKEISEALDVSERTVKAHLGNAYRKLGVTNRLELVTRLKSGI